MQPSSLKIIDLATSSETGVASQKILLNDKIGQQDQKPILSVRLTGLLMHALLQQGMFLQHHQL